MFAGRFRPPRQWVEGRNNLIAREGHRWGQESIWDMLGKRSKSLTQWHNAFARTGLTADRGLYADDSHTWSMGFRQNRPCNVYDNFKHQVLCVDDQTSFSNSNTSWVLERFVMRFGRPQRLSMANAQEFITIPRATAGALADWGRDFNHIRLHESLKNPPSIIFGRLHVNQLV